LAVAALVGAEPVARIPAETAARRGPPHEVDAMNRRAISRRCTHAHGSTAAESCDELYGRGHRAALEVTNGCHVKRGSAPPRPAVAEVDEAGLLPLRGARIEEADSDTAR